MVSPNSAEEVAHNFEVHLLAWQHLAARCEGLNLRLYKLRPKHHYFDHIGEDVQRTRLNMWKLASCNNDESFLGYLKRIGIRCHQASMVQRLFQRYLLFLSVRWHDAESHWRINGVEKTESGALVQSMATHAPNWGVSYCFFWSDPKVETITVRNLCLNCSQASVAFHQLYLRLRTHYSVCRLRAAWRGHQGRAMLKLSTPINRCQNSWPVGYTPKKHWGYTTRNGNARCVLELQAANPWNMMCLRPL